MASFLQLALKFKMNINRFKSGPIVGFFNITKMNLKERSNLLKQFKHRHQPSSFIYAKKHNFSSNLIPLLGCKRFSSCGSGVRFRPLFAISIFGFKIFEDGESEDSDLEMLIKRGILAMMREQFDVAEQLFHLALKTAQEQQNELGVTYLFDLMANLAYQKEEFVKAEKLFKSVLQRLLATGTEKDDNAVVEISLKLASIYAATDDTEKAVEGFHFCIATQDKKLKEAGEEEVDEDTLVLWAMSMDWYARFLIRLGKYDLAKKHFLKALEVCEKVNGSLNEQTAVLLNDIGSVCSLMKSYDEALDYLNRAIEIAKQIDSPDIASFYINLGTTQMERNLFDDAEKFCGKGVVLATLANNEEAKEEGRACLNKVKEFLNK